MKLATYLNFLSVDQIFQALHQKKQKRKKTLNSDKDFYKIYAYKI